MNHFCSHFNSALKNEQDGNLSGESYPRETPGSKLTSHEEQGVREKKKNFQAFPEAFGQIANSQPSLGAAEEGDFLFFCILIVGMWPHTAVIGTMQLLPRN